MLVYDGIPSARIARCWDGDWDHVDYLSVHGPCLGNFVPDEDDELEDLSKICEQSWKEREEWENRKKPCPNCVDCGEEPNMIKLNFDYCEECLESLQEESDSNGWRY